MKRSKFKEAFGAKHIANLSSQEIHKVDALHTNCHIELIKNGRYIWSSKKWLKKGFNGCCWCFPKADKG